VDDNVMTMNDAVQRKGDYILFWRSNNKDAGKVLSCNLKEKEVTYELISGADRGKVRTAEYDPLQKVVVYDEESVVLAVMQK